MLSAIKDFFHKDTSLDEAFKELKVVRSQCSNSDGKKWVNIQLELTHKDDEIFQKMMKRVQHRTKSNGRSPLEYFIYLLLISKITKADLK